MPSQATTIKDLIELNWSLTGNLAKTPSDIMQEPVFFFDRPQVLGNEVVKAIEVVKINNNNEENIVQHPNFLEVADYYEITIRYRVVDVETQYAQSLQDVEEMATELITILDAQFDPNGASAEWFISSKRWRRDDHADQGQPELKRVLALELTQIRGHDDSVFRANSAVMIFDEGLSNGDNLPTGDYNFETVRELSIVEGYPQKPYLTKDKGRGQGVPHLIRGWFSGVFSALIFGRTADVTGSTLEKVTNIYKTQSATIGLKSQNAEVVMLHNLKNTLSSPQTFQTKSYMRITRIDKLTTDESLLAYRIVGQLTQPSEAQLV